MRILLINPPCGPRTIGLKHIARIEPLALELIGAGVSKGHDVRVVDMMVRPSDLEAVLREFEPDVAGVTSEIVHAPQAAAALRTVRRAAPRCVTVVGGHHPTLCPEDFDDEGVDLVVQGEGVEAFAGICDVVAGGGSSFDGVAGLQIRTPDGLRATAPRPFPADLDAQPFPDRSLTSRYRREYFYLFEKSVAAIRTSVGCSFNCSFCSCRVYSQGTFAPRSPELVLEEIMDLEEDFVMLCDDHSFHDPDRMRELAEMLLRWNVRKRYFAYARTDSIVANRDVFELWKRAGLDLVMTGLEAVDDERLRRTGKRTELGQNEQAVRIMEELGIGLSAGFLVEPGFQKEDFDAIRRYVRDRPAILLAELTPLTPFPGTPLHRRMRTQLVTDDRQVYDLQHFVTHTTMPPRKLYRLMLRAYRDVLMRVIRRLRLWRPRVLFAPRTIRVLVGLLRNQLSYRRAHQHVSCAASRNGGGRGSGRAS